MPTDLLKSVTADLVAHLETQMDRAKALQGAVTTYHRTRDPRAVTEIVRHLERIALLNGITLDLLFAADAALTAGTKREQEPI